LADATTEMLRRAEMAAMRKEQYREQNAAREKYLREQGGGHRAVWSEPSTAF
jgi:hypothetical protein